MTNFILSKEYKTDNWERKLFNNHGFFLIDPSKNLFTLLENNDLKRIQLSVNDHNMMYFNDHASSVNSALELVDSKLRCHWIEYGIDIGSLFYLLEEISGEQYEEDSAYLKSLLVDFLELLNSYGCAITLNSKKTIPQFFLNKASKEILKLGFSGALKVSNIPFYDLVYTFCELQKEGTSDFSKILEFLPNWYTHKKVVAF